MASLPNINENNVGFTQIDLLSKKKIGIKQWRVKEEKALMFAVEGIEREEDGIKEIVKFTRTCCDNEKTFDSLSRANVVYVLAQIRKKSKGKTIEYNCSCEKCKLDLIDEVDLSTDLKTKKFDQTPIKIGDDLVITIKEVPVSKLELLSEQFKKVTEYNFNFILASIDTIAFKGEVFEEFSEQECSDFIDELDSNSFKELVKKVNEAQADVSIGKSLVCGKCKTENFVMLEGLESFLAF